MRDLNTREKILQAARQLFIEHGFAGTSIGNIAKLAEINHSLIFHHFGNKEKLWLEVKQMIVKEANLQTKTLPSTTLPFKKFLQQLMQNALQFYRNNPDIVRMINWQRLEQGKEKNIGVTLSAESQAWLDAFKYYQKKGEINHKLKPEFILTLVLSIISSAALDPNIFINTPKKMTEYIKFCMALFNDKFD